MEIIYNNQTIKILTNCGFKTKINNNSIKLSNNDS